MSIETLKQDLRENLASLDSIEPTPEALKSHLKNSLWPFLEAQLDEMDEIDDAVVGLVQDMPDLLHEDTAEVFGAIIAQGAVLVAELRKRVGNDKALLQQIKAWGDLAAQGREILQDIVVEDDGEGDEDGDDEEGDEDDDKDETPPAAAAAEGGTP